MDSARVAVVGGSQGGGTALAVAGLHRHLAAAVAFVPFLCDFPHALRIAEAYPYREVVDYLAIHRTATAAALRTLSYFDGVNFAPRATAPGLFSVAMRDDICPPPTVYGAYNAYAGPREIQVWDFNGHEGGGILDEHRALHFLRGVGV